MVTSAVANYNFGGSIKNELYTIAHTVCVDEFSEHDSDMMTT